MEDFVRHRYKLHDSSHDMAHVRAVVRLTNTFCLAPEIELSNSDIAVADAAAWLHDLLDRKYVEDVDSVAAELQGSLVVSGLLDAVQSSRAVAIAKSISFSSRVLRHGKSPEELTGVDTVLYFYVSDADMLEAMGCIGVIRTCIFQAIHKKDSSIESALDYILSTLTRCANYMRHPCAVAAAAARRDDMMRIVSLVKHERGLTDSLVSAWHSGGKETVAASLE